MRTLQRQSNGKAACCVRNRLDPSRKGLQNARTSYRKAVFSSVKIDSTIRLCGSFRTRPSVANLSTHLFSEINEYINSGNGGCISLTVPTSLS